MVPPRWPAGRRYDRVFGVNQFRGGRAMGGKENVGMRWRKTVRVAALSLLIMTGSARAFDWWVFPTPTPPPNPTPPPPVVVVPPPVTDTPPPGEPPSPPPVQPPPPPVDQPPLPVEPQPPSTGNPPDDSGPPITQPPTQESPEPATLALALAGIGLVCCRRKK